TWLHRIAVNAALDRLRRRGTVHIAADAPDEHPQEAAEAAMPETPERIYARAETAVVVRRAMEGLSDTHSEALRLCDLEGESYATIAEVTECPLGTVMSRLFHARRKPARALSEAATGDGDLAALRAAQERGLGPQASGLRLRIQLSSEMALKPEVPGPKLEARSVRR